MIRQQLGYQVERTKKKIKIQQAAKSKCTTEVRIINFGSWWIHRKTTEMFFVVEQLSKK